MPQFMLQFWSFSSYHKGFPYALKAKLLIQLGHVQPFLQYLVDAACLVDAVISRMQPDSQCCDGWRWHLTPPA